MPSTHTSDANGGSVGSGSNNGGFSLMNSLTSKGGISGGSGGGNGDADSARLREGLSHNPNNSNTDNISKQQQQPSHLRSPPSPNRTGQHSTAAQPIRQTNSFTSGANPQQQQQQMQKPQQHRRSASYRNAPKGYSPKNVHKRQGSSDQSGGGRWNFPGLSPANSFDSQDRAGSVHTAATSQTSSAKTKNLLAGAVGKLSLKSTSFDNCYAPATPGYHDAFTLLDGVERASPGNTDATSNANTPSPTKSPTKGGGSHNRSMSGSGRRSFFPSSPKRNPKDMPPSSPRKMGGQQQPPSSPRRHAHAPQAYPPSPARSGGSGGLSMKKNPNPLFTQQGADGSGGGSSKSNSALPPSMPGTVDGINTQSTTHSPPSTPPHTLTGDLPGPPSGAKAKKSTPSPSSKARSASPLNFPLGKSNNSQRSASPLRHPSPLSGGASRVKKLLSRHSRSNSRSKGSGNYSDAVSMALQENNSTRDVDIIERARSAKSGHSAKSQEGIEVVNNNSPNKSRRGNSRGRGLRNRSPSPVRHLVGSDKNADLHMDRDSTASTPSFFGMRSSSPGRLKRNLKKRLQIPASSSSRPPQQPSSPTKNLPPSYPTDSEGSTGKGSVEDEVDGIDRAISLSLARTTMSFDVDDNHATTNVATPEMNVESAKPQHHHHRRINSISENDLDEEVGGYYINNTSFNIFESHEFLTAMGGDVDDASLATNYIRTGDSLCVNNAGGEEEGKHDPPISGSPSRKEQQQQQQQQQQEEKEQGPHFERAIQAYYAGLGVVLTRVKEWMVEQRGGGDGDIAAPSIAPCDEDMPRDEATTTKNPFDDPPPNHQLMYNDFVTLSKSPETNVLLLAMSSILLRAGNAHFRLKHYEEACGDYASAQSYRSLRSSHTAPETEDDDTMMHVEDSKLQGRISNNLACAMSKRGMYDEARGEYTKALQIKQGTLEALHRGGGDAKRREVDDKAIVSDIASTFHNIGLLRMECGDEAKKAEKAYKQSLSLRVKKFGLDDLGVSATLSALGDLYYRRGQYDDAFRSYKESLRIWKSHSGRRTDARTADHYYNIGLVFHAKGPYIKAKTSAAECLRIRRLQCGEGSLEVASALYLLGLVAMSMGSYVEAMSLLQESLDIRWKELSLSESSSQQQQWNKDHHLLLLNVQLAIGIVHQKRNEIDSAMNCFAVVLKGRAQRLGKDHISVSEVLQAIGVTYAACTNEYQKAYQTLEEALRIRRSSSSGGAPSLEVAETLDSLSLVIFKSGDTDKAIELSEEALEVLKTAVWFDHMLVGKTLKHTGDYYQDVGAYEDALEAYTESLRVMTAWYGREHVFLAEVLNEIGVTRFKNGEFLLAKESFTEALRLMRLTHNEANKSAIFPTLNHLGHALYKNNELKLAAETYIESFNIQVSIVTGDANDGLKEFSTKLDTIKDRVAAMEREEKDVTEISESLGGIASILRYLGLVIQDQGDFEAALSANKLSLSVRLCQPVKDHSAMALMAETIAMFEYKRNNSESAMNYFNQALEAKKSYQGESTIDVARTVNNLANIHFSLGNLDDAMKLYQEALEIKRHCLGDDSDEVANTLNNIAHVMANAGKEQDALKAYHNVVKIKQDRYGKSHASVATTLASMGDVYIKLGKLDIAMTYFEQCIRIQKLHQDNRCDERVLENLGSIYGKLGEWHKAEMTFKDIVDIKREAQGNESLDVAKTLDLLAVSYIEQNRYADSIEHLQEALRIRKACLDRDDDQVLASLNKLAFVYKYLDMTEQMLGVKEEFDAIQARRRDASS